MKDHCVLQMRLLLCLDPDDRSWSTGYQVEVRNPGEEYWVLIADVATEQPLWTAWADALTRGREAVRRLPEQLPFK